MFSVNIVRRLRPCVFPQSVWNVHIAAARRGAAGTVCGVRAAGQRQLQAATRSLLCPINKVQLHCLSTRCLSTATHSEDGNLIYTGNLGTAVRGLKMFSFSTSGASIAIMPHILLKTTIGFKSVALQAAFFGVVGFFTLITPVLLHLFTKRYVVRLYHNPDTDTYTAITYSFLPLEKRNVFHQRQVRIPSVTKMFTTFYAGKMGMLVNPNLFPIPQDYNHLMGYDKPFSFNTDDLDTPDKS